MTRFFLRWIILAASVLIAAKLTSMVMDGFSANVSNAQDFLRLMIGAAILSLINATLGNILKFLTLPLNCLTLGLFSLVINAFMLEIAGRLDFGFTVTSFWAALLGSLILSVINGALGNLLPDKKR